MKRISHLFNVLLTLVAVLPLSRPAAAANDLLNIANRAETQDIPLAVAKESLNIDRERRRQAFAGLLPSVAVGADRHRSELVTGEFSGTATESWSVAATAALPVVNIELVQRYRSASAELQAGKLRYEAARQDRMLRVVSIYFDVLSAGDQLSTAQAARDAFATLRNQAQARADSGVGPRNAVTQAQSFFDIALQPVIDSSNRLADALRALAEATGSFQDTIDGLSPDVDMPNIAPGSLESWLATSFSRNPDLLVAEHVVKAAERAVSAERARMLPNVQLQSTLVRERGDTRDAPRADTALVGIVAHWNLFQGGATASRIRESRAVTRQAELLKEESRRAIEREIRDAHLSLQTGAERIEVTRRALDSTRATVEAASSGLDIGTNSDFELLSAQTRFFSAQRQYMQARLDYLWSGLRLKRAAGVLSMEDIKVVDALLSPANRVESMSP